MQTLDGYRRELDEIDARMLALLEERLAVARGVARLKRAEGLPICDPVRERDMMASRLARVSAINRAQAQQMMRLLVELSKETQAQFMEDDGQ